MYVMYGAINNKKSLHKVGGDWLERDTKGISGIMEILYALIRQLVITYRF